MKKWVTSWKKSVQPRKQRKYRANAPIHAKRKFVSVHLDKKLRGEYSTRSIYVRKGDTVKVLRGSKKGLQGKVADVDLNSSRVYIEGQTREAVGGKKILIPFNPSNLMITELKLDDKKRESLLSRKSGKTIKPLKEKKEKEEKNASKKTENTKQLEHKA